MCGIHGGGPHSVETGIYPLLNFKPYKTILLSRRWKQCRTSFCILFQNPNCSRTLLHLILSSSHKTRFSLPSITKPTIFFFPLEQFLELSKPSKIVTFVHYLPLFYPTPLLTYKLDHVINELEETRVYIISTC